MNTLLTEDTLLDSFHVENDPTVSSDESFNQFKTALHEMDKMTCFESYQAKDLRVMQMLDSKDDTMYFLKFDPDDEAFQIENAIMEACKCRETAGTPEDLAEAAKKVFTMLYRDGIIAVKTQQFLNKGNFQNLIQEITDTTKYVMYANGGDSGRVKLYTVSDRISSDFCLAGLKGDFVFKPSMARSYAIANQFRVNRDVKLVVRQINGMRKIFALRSPKYTPLAQSFIVEVIEQLRSGAMGAPVVNRWSITHPISSIYIEFPDKAEEMRTLYKLPDTVTPGLYLATSDTGDCSITVYETWRAKHGITMHHSISQMHTGDITVEKILDLVDKKIFSEYAKIPEALCDLMCTNVTPSSLDLSTPAGCIANKTILDSLMRELSQTLGLVKAIGKKNEKIVIDAMTNSLDASISYSAYDIAMMLMDLPSAVLGLSEARLMALSKAVGEVVFVDFNKLLHPTSVVVV